MTAAMTLPLLQRDGGSFAGLSGSGRACGPIMRVAAVAAYVQQHGGGDFTSPPGLGRACPAWCVLAAVSGRHPQVAVEDALQVAVLLPPSGYNGPVCSCRGVRSATAYGGGDVLSRVVVMLPDLVSRCFISG